MRFLIFLCFLPVSVFSQSNGMQSKLEAYLKLMTALKYNETCSWKTEFDRLAFVKTTAEIGPDPPTVYKYMEKVLRENKPLCSAAKHLICDGETKRCKCGEAAMQVYDRFVKDKDPFIVTNDNITGEFHCGWKRGGYCQPLIEASNGVLVSEDVKCQEGSSCMETMRGRKCTEENLLEHIRKHRQGKKTKSEFVGQFMGRIYNGEVCACMGKDFRGIINGQEKTNIAFPLIIFGIFFRSFYINL